MLKPSQLFAAVPLPIAPLKPYRHLYDADGSVKSVCMYCFAEVCKGYTVDDLARHEKSHCCDEKIRTA